MAAVNSPEPFSVGKFEGKKMKKTGIGGRIYLKYIIFRSIT